MEIQVSWNNYSSGQAAQLVIASSLYTKVMGSNSSQDT